MTDLWAMLRRRRGEILRIARAYGVERLRVFGSVVRGDCDDESDIDLLVELAPRRSLFDLGGFQYEVETLLGRRVDVVTPRALKPRVRARVVREAVPL